MDFVIHQYESATGILDKWKWSRSVVSDSATPWIVAYEVPPSTEFSKQEYWSGLPFPSPGNLPDPGIEPGFPALQADAFTIWTNMIFYNKIIN